VPTKTGHVSVPTLALVRPTIPAFPVIGLNNPLASLNLTVLLTDHLTRRLQTLESLQRTKRLSSSTKKHIYVPKGRSFYTRPYTSRLRTLRTTHG